MIQIKFCIYSQEGFCLRIKGIHFVTESNTVKLLVALCKQIFSKKIADRVRVHKTLDSLYEVVPREILPSDFGGDEISSLQLRGKNHLSMSQHLFWKYFFKVTITIFCL